MNFTSTVYENRLRQRIMMLEDSLARVASTRKELKDNVDVVKNEVRSSFGHQLNRLRSREQQILEKLETVASVKDNILSQQQDNLHQALGACTQGLQWLQTAYDDLKLNKLTSVDSMERRILDILNTYSSVDFMPRETPHMSFESDPVALRRSISAFGQIRTSSIVRNSESLPCALEDYEDDDHSHALSHKSVHGPAKFVNILKMGRPIIIPSNNRNEWLLKEALTSSAVQQPTVTITDGGLVTGLTKHASSISSEPICDTTPRGHHHQIHNWLHHMKTTVENEPAVFEDFHFGDNNKKALEYKNEIELMKDKEALFRKHFDQIIRSPDQGWLFDNNVAKNVVQPMEINISAIGKAIAQCYQIHQQQHNGDDVNSINSSSSCTLGGNSSFCVINSNGSCVSSTNETLKSADEKTEQCCMQYADYWSSFLKNLWSSSDSMWLLPCASSDDRPVMLSGGGSGDDDVVSSLDFGDNARQTLSNGSDDMWASVTADTTTNNDENLIDAMDENDEINSQQQTTFLIAEAAADSGRSSATNNNNNNKDYLLYDKQLVGYNDKKLSATQQDDANRRKELVVNSSEDNNDNGAQNFLPKNFALYRRGDEANNQMNAFHKLLDLNGTFPTKSDRDTWLFKPQQHHHQPLSSSSESSAVSAKDCVSLQQQQQQLPQRQCPAFNELEPMSEAYEKALGWKAVLEKVHGLGDEKWLLKSYDSMEQQETRMEEVEAEKNMQVYGHPVTGF